MYWGIDGCRAGWIVIGLTDNGEYVDDLSPNIDSFWNRFGRDIRRVFIDIPMGLPKNNERTVEKRARQILKGRASSVFSVPMRAAFTAATYEEATAINQNLVGKKISKQAWHIMPKIAEVDQFLRTNEFAREKFYESHPELAFWALAGLPLYYSKKSALGFTERMAILRQFRPDTDEIVGTIYQKYQATLSEDDVVDALVLAVCAKMGNSTSLPEVPEYDEYGIPMRMVYPQTESCSIDLTQSPDTLFNLIRSTVDLHHRFERWPEFEATLRVFREEVDELIEAVQQGSDQRHIAEEAADVFVTAIGMCMVAGVDAEAIIEQTRAVIRKNDAKTHETHQVNEFGKIARRKT